MTTINIGLYLSLVLFVATLVLGIRALKEREIPRILILIVTLLLILSPPLTTRFLPQTAWTREAFVPCAGVAAVGNDVIAIGSGWHPLYVLRRTQGQWVREATFVREEETSKAVIGDPNDYGYTINDCAAILASPSSYDSDRSLGVGVAISNDTVFFSSWSHQSDQIRNDTTTYTSSYRDGQWSEPEPLPPPGNDSTNIGFELDVSGDVLVSGGSGTVHVYRRDPISNRWMFSDTIPNPKCLREDIKLGRSVAVDDNTIVVGSRLRGAEAHVFVHNKQSDCWRLEGTLSTEGIEPGYSENLGTTSRFGVDVDIQGDTLAVGAYGLNFPDGIVFIYTRNRRTGSWKLTDTLKPIGGRPFWNIRRYFFWYGFGADVSIDGDTIAVSTGAHESNLYSGGAFTFTSNYRRRWRQQSRFTLKEAQSKERFGEAVYISKDTLVIEGVSNGSKGFYIFKRSEMQ